MTVLPRKRVRTRGHITALVPAIAVALALGACGSSSSSSSPSASSGGSAPASSGSSSSSSSPTNIAFSLDYLIDGLHAPFFSAQALGYYKQNNLSVSIHTSTGSSDSVDRVATGKAQLGLSDAPTALTAIAKGLPIKIVGMLLLHNANSTETLKTSNITTLQGLEGHTVGITPGGSERGLITALLALNHVPESKVHFVSVSVQNGEADLLAGRVDSISFFPQIFVTVANKVNILPWFKYGLDIYGTAIIANTGFLSAHPAAVTSFVHDSMEGLKFTLQNPDQAAAYVTKAAGSNGAFYHGEMPILKPYWYDPPLQTQGLGYMTASGWNTTESVAVKYLGLSKMVPLSQVYTNQYLGPPVQP